MPGARAHDLFQAKAIAKAELDQPTLTIDPLEILNLPCTLAKNAITSTSVLAQLSTSTSTIKDFAIRMR